jgi:poly-beta-hydroxyalkanoate depolymerase
MKQEIIEANKHFGGIAAAFVLVYAVLEMLGAQLPMPAWASDVYAMESKIDKLYIVSLRGQLRAAKNGLKLIQREIKEYETANINIPSILIDEAQELQIEVRELTKIIKDTELDINGKNQNE